MSEWLLHGIFALGGGLGAILRHWVSRAITHDFPLATLLVNVLGSVGLGLALGAMGDLGAWPDHSQRLVFGFCGGFTTFSSFAYQTLDLHSRHSLIHGAGNILASLILCFVGFWIGLTLPGLL
ncbi:MAG: fluoride efflux transporter CrcB [Mangrovicoccus sp.]|nr:fluoride efflux transporter CrcB [Mangrovicoccus sp.]